MSPPARADSSPLPSPTNWALIKRLLGLAWQYRVGCIIVVGMHLSLVAFMIFGVGLAGAGIDYVRYRTATWMWLTTPAEWSAMFTMAVIGLGVLAMAVFRGFMRFQAVLFNARLTQKIVVRLRTDVYDKLQRLSFRFYDANESGSIINRVTGDVQAVRMFVDNVMVQVITVVTTLSLFLIYMLKIHVWLTVACLATVPLKWILAVLFSKTVRPMYLSNREKMDHAVRTLSENVQGVHVVKCFNQEQAEIDKFGRANKAVTDERFRIFWWISLFTPSIGFLAQVNVFVLLVYGGFLVMRHDQALSTGGPAAAVGVGVSLGTLLVFSEFLRQFSNQIQMIANIANSVQRSLTGAERVFEVLDAPIEIQSKPNARRMPRARGKVEFEHVSFGYDGTASVLRDVSFVAEPGQCIAVLGATGAGKSSLLSLIPRFYDAIDGRVLVDDVDVRDLDVDDLRRSVGLVFQESFLFSATIAENIAFGHPDASIEQVRKAARIAAADTFIEELANGYDTVIGENGVDLSGGQRQRLAIARAVLLEPPILLLDDATSAIDPETEHEILTAMNNAMKGRTTFVVAHRLSTLRRSDQVIVLDKGQVVQAGTHDELMSERGHYRHAAKLQVADAESRRLLGVEEEAPI